VVADPFLFAQGHYTRVQCGEGHLIGVKPTKIDGYSCAP